MLEVLDGPEWEADVAAVTQVYRCPWVSHPALKRQKEIAGDSSRQPKSLIQGTLSSMVQKHRMLLHSQGDYFIYKFPHHKHLHLLDQSRHSCPTLSLSALNGF